jgi:hypothetical protein
MQRSGQRCCCFDKREKKLLRFHTLVLTGRENLQDMQRLFVEHAWPRREEVGNTAVTPHYCASLFRHYLHRASAKVTFPFPPTLPRSSERSAKPADKAHCYYRYILACDIASVILTAWTEKAKRATQRALVANHWMELILVQALCLSVSVQSAGSPAITVPEQAVTASHCGHFLSGNGQNRVHRFTNIDVYMHSCNGPLSMITYQRLFSTCMQNAACMVSWVVLPASQRLKHQHHRHPNSLTCPISLPS